MSKMTSAIPFSGSTVSPWRVTALITSFNSCRPLSIASPRARPSSDVSTIRASNDEKRSRCVSWMYKSSDSHRRKSRKVLRLKADLDLADGLHGREVRDKAEHPLGGIREQFVRGPPVRADADIGRVLDFLVAHAEERRRVVDEASP